MPTINKRKLGRSGIEVSPVGMGCWAIGGLWQWLDGQGGWGEVDDAESIRAIQVALESGINFFDTAANYGTGHSESILGQALAKKRHQTVIATKFGFKVDEFGKKVTRYDYSDEVIKNVRKECEASLRRLGTDYIDLYQLHVWDYPLEPVADLLKVLEALVREGKIRYYGWSTDSTDAARAFAQGEHCTAIQHDLNIIMDAPEMLAVCKRLDLASVNRSPLARGALSGKYHQGTTFPENDVRRDAWSQEHFFTPTLSKLNILRDILTSEGRTLVQGALAWIWARSDITIAIPGCRTVAQVNENAGAMKFGALSTVQMQEIDRLLER